MNEATILYDILRLIRNNQANNQKDMWTNIFHLKSTEVGPIYARLGQLMQLPVRIKKKVIAVSSVRHDSKEKKLRWMSSFYSVVDRINLADGTANIKKTITAQDSANHFLTDLEHCCDFIDDNYSVAETNLTELKKTFIDLLNWIKNTLMHQNLKEILMNLINEALDAIGNVNLHGYEPIQKTSSSFFGMVELFGEIKEKIKKSNKYIIAFTATCAFNTAVQTASYWRSDEPKKLLNDFVEVIKKLPPNIKIRPITLKTANRLGIQNRLSEIIPTGRNGYIIKKDLIKYNEENYDKLD